VNPLILVLIAHGLIGGADVIVNHEMIAKLPSRAGVGMEQILHSTRELLFATLFLALAWLEWHGLAAMFIAALVLLELAVSALDTVIEWEIRVLPASERVMHFLLFINMGIVIALLGRTLLQWWHLPTQLLRTDYGFASAMLSALALLALGWSVRDGLNAWRRTESLEAAGAATPTGPRKP
jgi:hypothetical protein